MSRAVVVSSDDEDRNEVCEVREAVYRLVFPSEIPLTVLCLDDCAISDLTILASILKTNNTLTQLTLNSNQIEDVNPLCYALCFNNTLKVLRLENNQSILEISVYRNLRKKSPTSRRR